MRIERKSRGRSVAGVVALAALLLAAAPVASAQLMRYLGSITTIDGNTLTVKTDAGDVHQVQVPTTAILKRIAPGQTDLTKADPLDFGSLAVGDRVLVTLDPNITSGTPQAARIIAIKQADVTKKQEAENAEWSQGVHGSGKERRYRDRRHRRDHAHRPHHQRRHREYHHGYGAQALRARFGRIRSGATRSHQRHPSRRSIVCARNQKRGWNRNRGGWRDYGHVPQHSRNRDLHRHGSLHGDGEGPFGQEDRAARHCPHQPPMRSCGGSTTTWRRCLPRDSRAIRRALAAAEQTAAEAVSGSSAALAKLAVRAAERMDLETILERAPQIQLGALKKGDAVMIVATEDASGLSAVKLLAGVEPLLEAPEAADLLSSWSLSSGEGEAAQ